ncbi:MBL fold metallo-hydrolase [Nocardia xishanensis]
MTGPDTSSSAEDRLRRPARMRTIRLGRLRITYIPDGQVALKPRGWLPDTTDADWAPYRDHLDEHGNLVAGIGALLVQRGRRALLIDAGVGPIDLPDTPANPMIGAMHGGQLLDNLARVDGLRGIEAVAITHLHFDHIGWSLHPTPGSDKSPFHGVRHYIGEYEWNWWRSLTPAMVDTFPAWAKAGVLTPPILDTIADTRLITHGATIFPGIRATIVPGHSTGHMTFTISSCRRRMVVLGDALHTPVQVRHPEWPSASDYAPAEAAHHRTQLINQLADTGDLAFGVHFADVPFGHVQRDNLGRTSWVPYD